MTRVLARLHDPVLATVWRDLLVSAGIPAEVTGRNMNAVYGGLPAVTLIVRDEDYDEARRLIADVEAGEAIDDPESPIG